MNKTIVIVLFCSLLFLKEFVIAEDLIIPDNDFIFTFEISPANEYTGAVGLGFYHVKENDISFYVNFYGTLSGYEPDYDSLDISSFGDPVTKKYKSLTLINLGLTKKIFDGFSIYAGVGYAGVSGKAQKYDSLHILAEDGYYYVEDPENNESGVNLNTGVLYKIYGQFEITVGYQSFSNSINIGYGYCF